VFARRQRVDILILATLLVSGGLAGGALADFDGDGRSNVAEVQGETSVLSSDTDSDGLDDGAEIEQYETDPTDADTDGDGLNDGPEVAAYGTDPGDSDTDGEGLPDGAEVIEHGTDPTNADTDGDGLDDQHEIEQTETDPTDSDTDGDDLSDGAEVSEHGTNPRVADTDADGLNDGAELHDHGTDPTDSDTDGDGLNDGAEIEHETDPTVADTDGDGLDDSAEVNLHETDPLQSDTDGDGLDDSPEVHEYRTDPAVADTDADGLDDGAEINEYETNPIDRDTDGDGLPDGAEVHNSERYPGADPLRTDVYVEVDRMEGTELPDREAERIVDRYADAPVKNPDGSAGIALHFVESETVPATEPLEQSLARDAGLRKYKDEYFENDGYGYHYLLIAKDIEDAGGYAYRGQMAATHYDFRGATGYVVMHELGHSVGLSSRDFDGIDSEKYSHHEYPSVMNYNVGAGEYKYSDGTAGPNDFDDWAHIASQMYTPSTEKLDL
jgi:hypothetical protein